MARKTKKVLAAIIAIGMVIAAAGCAENSTTNPAAGSQQQDESVKITKEMWLEMKNIDPDSPEAKEFEMPEVSFEKETQNRVITEEMLREMRGEDLVSDEVEELEEFESPAIVPALEYVVTDAEGNVVESGKAEIDGIRLTTSLPTTIPVGGSLTFRPYSYTNGWAVPAGWYFCWAYELSASKNITCEVRQSTSSFPGTVVSTGHGPTTAAKCAYAYNPSTSNLYTVTMHNTGTSNASLTKFEVYIIDDYAKARTWFLARR